MQIEFDCIPCIYRQILEASRMVTSDKEVIKKILHEFARMIPEIKPEESAPEVTTRIQNYLKSVTGEIDPYSSFKEANIKMALEHYPLVEEIIEDSEEPLLGALVMSAMGNSIDAGVSLEVDITGNVERAINDGFKYNDYQLFQEKLTSCSYLLIIADNAGEAVFDKLLIKELGKYGINISYAVREKPVLNDVTLEEAQKIGIDEYCKIISSGCDTPGIILSRASREFMSTYSEADIIISKGQGNLEGLLGKKKPIFYLLKVKCQLIANKLGSGLKVGDFVFMLR